jgi:hypothetical protein
VSKGRKYLSAREAEHSTPNAFQAGKPDQIMCVEHHKVKTRRDRKAIAKVNRITGKAGSQRTRREQRKADGKPPLIQNRNILRRNSARTREQILGEDYERSR